MLALKKYVGNCNLAIMINMSFRLRIMKPKGYECTYHVLKVTYFVIFRTW